jgi:CubicO group peptidase (beta-lactamase class C family)
MKMLKHLKRVLTGGIFFVFLLFIASVVFTGCKRERNDPVNGHGEGIDGFISQRMDSDHVVGLAACIVKNNGMAWTGVYGYANIEKNIRVSADTLFGLGSISKTVVVTVLMQLYEQGLFQLDEDVNLYLPFSVRNPAYPSVPITFRMLLTHTSSMSDNWDVMTYYWGQDSPVPLGEYLVNYLTPGGAYFYPNKSFLPDHAPGASFTYCNNALVLVAYLAELMAGSPFEQLCEDHVFRPLGMENATWFLAGVDRDAIAMPYKYENGRHVPFGYYHYSDWPAGILRASVNELALFLTAYIQGGTANGYTMLESSTVDLILSSQAPLNGSMGLVWFREGDRREHGGADLGVEVFMSFRPSDGVGVIVLTNSEARGAVVDIVNELYSYSNEL